MSKTSFHKIVEWYDLLWEVEPKRDYSDVIMQRAARAQNAAEHDALMHVLHFEYVRTGRFSEAVKLLEQQIEKDPSNLQSQIRLTEDLLYYVEDFTAAKQQANVAYRIASQQGKFVRRTLDVRARAAKADQDYSLLADCMEALLSTVTMQTTGLVLESDFIIGLPEGAVPSELLERYKAATKDSQ